LVGGGNARRPTGPDTLSDESVVRPAGGGTDGLISDAGTTVNYTNEHRDDRRTLGAILQYSVTVFIS